MTKNQGVTATPCSSSDLHAQDYDAGIAWLSGAQRTLASRLPGAFKGSRPSSGELVEVLGGYPLPSQEIKVVSPSPRFVPSKVLALTEFLHRRFRGDWRSRAGVGAEAPVLHSGAE
jgi:hypothetical protein